MKETQFGVTHCGRSKDLKSIKTNESKALEQFWYTRIITMAVTPDERRRRHGNLSLLHVPIISRVAKVVVEPRLLRGRRLLARQPRHGSRHCLENVVSTHHTRLSEVFLICSVDVSSPWFSPFSKKIKKGT